MPSVSSRRGVDRMAVLLLAPAADEIEVLEREAERVHDRVARGAGRVRAMHLEALARTVSPDELRRRAASFARSAAAPGGGLGTAAPSRFCTIHWPRTTGDVRFGADVVVRMLPWPSSPRRGLSGGSATRRM